MYAIYNLVNLSINLLRCSFQRLQKTKCTNFIKVRITKPSTSTERPLKFARRCYSEVAQIDHIFVTSEQRELSRPGLNQHLVLDRVASRLY